MPGFLCRVSVPSMTVDGHTELSNGDTCALGRRGHRGIRISLSAINHKVPQFRQASPSGIHVATRAFDVPESTSPTFTAEMKLTSSSVWNSLRVLKLPAVRTIRA